MHKNLNEVIKYIVLILSVFLLSSTMAISQTRIGVFAGLNSSKLAGDVPANAKYKSLMGANIGAFVDFNLTEGLFLSLQPSYSQEGVKLSYTVPDMKLPVDSVSIRINYFSLPVLLKITSINKRFYAIAGVETAMLLNSSETIGDVEGEINAKVSDLNIAMHFGAGIRIPVGVPTLFVELRYAQGLVNLTDEPLDSNTIPRVKTSGTRIMVGIEIPLKKSN